MLETVKLTYRLLNDANPSATGMDASRAMTVFTSSMGPWRRVVARRPPIRLTSRHRPKAVSRASWAATS